MDTSGKDRTSRSLSQASDARGPRMTNENDFLASYRGRDERRRLCQWPAKSRVWVGCEGIFLLNLAAGVHVERRKLESG